MITHLRTVQFGWRQERIAESAEEIRQLGHELYGWLRTLAEHLADGGKGLTWATEAYNSTVGSFETRALTGARTFAERGAGEGKMIVEFEPVELSIRRVWVES